MSAQRDVPQPRRRVKLTIASWLIGFAVAGIGLALGANMSPGSPYRLGSIAVVALLALPAAPNLRARRMHDRYRRRGNPARCGGDESGDKGQLMSNE